MPFVQKTLKNAKFLGKLGKQISGFFPMKKEDKDIEDKVVVPSTKFSVRDNSREDFEIYLNSISANQYAYFRFTSKGFAIGYIEKSCNGTCSFIASNLDNNDIGGHINNDRKGVIHTKEELASFLSEMSGEIVYFHRRKYISNNDHTVIITDRKKISESTRIENRGGSCCPPAY